MRWGLVAAAGFAACGFQNGTTTHDGGTGDVARDVAGDAASGLVDRGLLVRYFMAEAASGQTPTALLDAAPSPLDLPIAYSSQLAYAGASGHRGLEWGSAGDSAVASVPLTATKLAVQLTGKTTWTFEVVADVKAVSPPSGLDCRIFTIATGTNGYGTAGMITSDLGHVTVEINNSTATTWAVDETQGPFVMDVVVDTNQPPGSRVKFFLNGAAQPLGGGSEPTLGAGLAIAATDHLSVGNVDSGGRSFAGDETYAAIYNVALTSAEVARNASALQANDDM
jgi:hypothetical protein